MRIRDQKKRTIGIRWFFCYARIGVAVCAFGLGGGEGVGNGLILVLSGVEVVIMSLGL